MSRYRVTQQDRIDLDAAVEATLKRMSGWHTTEAVEEAVYSSAPKAIARMHDFRNHVTRSLRRLRERNVVSSRGTAKAWWTADKLTAAQTSA